MLPGIQPTYRYVELPHVVVSNLMDFLMYNQLKRGIQIMVATPGRPIDHVKQDSIRLDDVKFVVLDEADRMLDMGFIDDIKFILSYIASVAR